MKKSLLSCIAFALISSCALADTVKIGMLLDFTETSEPEASAIVMGGELAVTEVANSDLFLNGRSVVPVRGDSTCTNKERAITNAERMIRADRVHAIIGGSCSDTTMAILEQSAITSGILMISPSATSPALSKIEDDGLFFRTVPSDSRQSEVMAMILSRRNIKSVAVAYIDNYYGKGLATGFLSAYEASGGTVTTVVPLKVGQSNYSSEADELAAAGGELLTLFSYPDHGGKEIVQRSLDNNAFDTFMFPDGMVGNTITDHFGNAISGSFGTIPGADTQGRKILIQLASNHDFDASGAFVAETYDATALVLLAMQSAGSSDSAIFKSHIERVANEPGVKIGPGELVRAMKILADGGQVNYVGATSLELIDGGEPSGSYREMEVRNGQFETVAIH